MTSTCLLSVLLLTGSAKATQPSFEDVLRSDDAALLPERSYLEHRLAQDLCDRSATFGTTRLSGRVLGAIGDHIYFERCASLGRWLLPSPVKQLKRMESRQAHLTESLDERSTQLQVDQEALETLLRLYYADLMQNFTAEKM